MLGAGSLALTAGNAIRRLTASGGELLIRLLAGGTALPQGILVAVVQGKILRNIDMLRASVHTIAARRAGHCWQRTDDLRSIPCSNVYEYSF